MASTIKQRLRRYNGTDYDTIHLESSSEQILRPSDSMTTTVENGLSRLNGHFYKTTGFLKSVAWHRIFTCRSFELHTRHSNGLSMIISINEFNWRNAAGSIMVAITCLNQREDVAVSGSGFTLTKCGTPNIDKIRVLKVSGTTDTAIDIHYTLNLQATGNETYFGLMCTSGPFTDVTVGLTKVDDAIPSGYVLMYMHTI